MFVIDCIKNRRSVRQYGDCSIDLRKINTIVESAIWAPSGKNCQPWKFKIITNKSIIEEISNLSASSKWIKKASCLIIVFLDKKCSYHYLKDVQSCGAAIQNILLAAYEMSVGSCWVGDLLEKADVINKLFELDEYLELMGVVSLGYARGNPIAVGRKNINDFLI